MEPFQNHKGFYIMENVDLKKGLSFH